VRPQKAGGPAADQADGPSEDDLLGSPITSTPTPKARSSQLIRAELIGSDRCSAAGLTASGHAPVLALARLLIDAGHNPVTPLEVWRGDRVCLHVRSIGEAARLRVASHGVGFEVVSERTAGPPVSSDAPRLARKAQRGARHRRPRGARRCTQKVGRSCTSTPTTGDQGGRSRRGPPTRRNKPGDGATVTPKPTRGGRR